MARREWPERLRAGASGRGKCEGEEVAGSLHLFDERLVDSLNVAVHLLQAPESLAWLLEAAGAVALERCGAILDERTAAAAASAE